MSQLNGISSEIAKALATKSAAPFLFLGSGFSRRYIGLETWAELLEKFSDGVKDFEYYLASSDSRMPMAAQLLADDYFEYWWSDEAFKEIRAAQGKKMQRKSSPLKLEISRYLREKSKASPASEHLKQELSLLNKLNIDGVITTNWDSLIESIFPEYKVFIGQEELIFSNPQSIAEIYKIHGCCAKPDTLVLTEDDYASFEKKYSYLVAKLITIFIEHPVFFIGYSLADENIQNMLGSIVGCLTDEQLPIFSKNLYFVKRAPVEGKSQIYPSTMQFGSYALNLQVIETSDFSEVYAGIETVKRKIPARVLRVCKEQMYELVKSTSPDNKLAVANLDDIEDGSDIEFVVGVGVAKAENESGNVAQQGYTGITQKDLFWDVITDENGYDPDKVLLEVFPNMPAKHGTFFPGYKYLKEVGLTSLDELDGSKYAEVKPFFTKYDTAKFRSSSFARPFIKYAKSKSAAEIVAEFPVEKAAAYLPFLDPNAFDLDIVKGFLVENFDRIFDKSDSYATYYKKLAVLYDRIRQGFHPA
ncbi:SIR2 family protein [Novosphingobium sp. Leaf2]|uniref:SIR2 family protein n=1 Tax=Novosphingobium sp. Leaf2 TaxID=1735670 RepID=UPI0006F7AA68|nr:SIR2 family protein [Novosphingobium sp. Leaf2]